MTVIARACRHDPDVASCILLGLGLGMGVQFVTVLQQRFILGFTQTPGLFVHQNTLGMITHLVLLPHLAMLLYGHTRHSSTWRNLAIVGMTAIVVLFTASRATIGLSVLGMALTYAVLALAGLTQRKVAVALLAGMAVMAIVPLAVSTFQNRFASSPLSEDVYDERAAFDRAAEGIFADHPLGVGTNHYVPTARDGGYSERAGVARSPGNRNSLVHNAYLLTAAEAGWPGLVTFILMLAAPLMVALASGWRMRDTLGGHLLLGLGVALLIVYLHSLYEWIVYSREVLYCLFMTMGMAFGLALKARASAPVRPIAAAMPRAAIGQGDR
jgi:O-antigen ligase